MDDLPVEAACEVMTLYCLILAFPFADTTAPIKSYPACTTETEIYK